MLHAGLDLSRRKIDVCLLSEQGEHLDQLVTPPDVDALRTLGRRIEEVHGEPVRAVIESMTGARLVHDTRANAGAPSLDPDADFRLIPSESQSAIADDDRLSLKSGSPVL